MTDSRVVQLTRAERRVIGELADDGPTDQQIADRLGVTHHTVKTLIKRALGEAGCTNRTQLVCALLRGRIVIQTVTQRRRSP